MLFLIVIIDLWIRTSTQVQWKLASRNLTSEGVQVKPCEQTAHCSKLVIHNLKYTDTGYYICSHKNSGEHKSSTYVFVKGKLSFVDRPVWWIIYLSFSGIHLRLKNIIWMIIISRVRVRVTVQSSDFSFNAVSMYYQHHYSLSSLIRVSLGLKKMCLIYMYR